MGKNKLRKFSENLTFYNLFQPSFEEVWGVDFRLKGKWNGLHFKNSNPIVLELGCGKGEYTINLGQHFQTKNFIGVDIKGARLWTGAKQASQAGMLNVAFIRTRIEHIASFFAPGEVSEIWITFPDPQPRPSKARKRLSSSRFLSYYQHFLKPNGLVHLKTDSQGLFEYAKALVEQNGLTVHYCTNNLYESGIENPILAIKTFYENQFLAQGKPITYLCFELSQAPLKEPVLE